MFGETSPFIVSKNASGGADSMQSGTMCVINTFAYVFIIIAIAMLFWYLLGYITRSCMIAAPQGFAGMKLNFLKR